MATQRCLYQLRRCYINTTVARTFHHSQFCNQNEENKTDQSKKKSFSETFKSELDDETKKKIEETLKYINESTSPLRSRLPKFKKIEPEKDNQNESAKPSTMEMMYQKVDAMKESLSGENLTKMSMEWKENIKLKSTSIMKSFEEMKKKEEKVDNVEKVSITKKVADFAKESGLHNNPLYKKTKDIGSESLSFVKDQQNSIHKMYKKSMDQMQTSGILETFKMSKEVKDDIAKKSGEVLDEVSKTRDQITLSAKEVADKLHKEKDDITSSETFQKVAETTTATLKTAAAELVDETRLRESEIYRSPETLQKRLDEDKDTKEKKTNTITADEKTTGVVYHKDSIWESNWNNFKNNNPMANQFLEYRTKYEESDNIFLRATRVVTDSITDVVRGMAQPTDISLTVAEVCKLDKTFNLTEFCTTLRFEIVPHVLEAYLKRDLAILKDWSHERAFGQFQHMIDTQPHKGKIKLIDIGECDIKMGKTMDQGPVFIFSVQTQQVYTNFDKAGEITEEKIKLITYLIAMCRDQTMFDHRSAWLVLEIHEHVQSDGYI